jgi:hypothetical protein
MVERRILRKAASQKAYDDSPLRTPVMRGVYYRHEFARRNRETVEASTKLLEEFFPATEKGLAEAILSSPEGGSAVVLIDSLLSECRQGRGSEKERKRRALAGFLKDKRVLPVPQVHPNGSLYPDSSKFYSYPLLIQEAEKISPAMRRLRESDAMVVAREYRKTMEFEWFAVVEIGLGKPVFMPVLPLGVMRTSSGLRKRAMQASFDDISNEPVLIDFTMPKNDLKDHLEVCIDRLDAMCSTGRLGPGDSVSTSRGHLHFDSFDQYLAASDSELIIAGDSKALPKDLHQRVAQQYLSEAEWSARVTKQNEASYSDTMYSGWKQNGQYWSAGYRLIV